MTTATKARPDLQTMLAPLQARQRIAFAIDRFHPISLVLTTREVSRPLLSLMSQMIGPSAVEEAYVAYLDADEHVISLDLISRGTVSENSISAHQIIQHALLHQATGLILFHNHPAHSVTFSPSDNRLAKSIEDLGNQLGMNFLGSYIVTDRGCFDGIDTINPATAPWLVDHHTRFIRGLNQVEGQPDTVAERVLGKLSGDYDTSPKAQALVKQYLSQLPVPLTPAYALFFNSRFSMVTGVLPITGQIDTLHLILGALWTNSANLLLATTTAAGTLSTADFTDLQHYLYRFEFKLVDEIRYQPTTGKTSSLAENEKNN